MRKFRQGAFTLAQDAGVPVVPIAVHGTHEALPKRGAIFQQTRPVEITVRVLEPVAHDAAAEAEELTLMVQEKISAELESMRDSSQV
jgi:1-acyl-sn-glycerol-3-phosphate acyltransferase